MYIRTTYIQNHDIIIIKSISLLIGFYLIFEDTQVIDVVKKETTGVSFQSTYSHKHFVNEGHEFPSKNVFKDTHATEKNNRIHVASSLQDKHV